MCGRGRNDRPRRCVERRHPRRRANNANLDVGGGRLCRRRRVPRVGPGPATKRWPIRLPNGYASGQLSGFQHQNQVREGPSLAPRHCAERGAKAPGSGDRQERRRRHEGPGRDFFQVSAPIAQDVRPVQFAEMDDQAAAPAPTAAPAPGPNFAAFEATEIGEPQPLPAPTVAQRALTPAARTAPARVQQTSMQQIPMPATPAAPIGEATQAVGPQTYAPAAPGYPRPRSAPRLRPAARLWSAAGLAVRPRVTARPTTARSRWGAHRDGSGWPAASISRISPGYAWPTYAAHPNYAAVTYPRQYSPTAWPYIGPFYPYPQVPLGWHARSRSSGMMGGGCSISTINVGLAERSANDDAVACVLSAE